MRRHWRLSWLRRAPSVRPLRRAATRRRNVSLAKNSFAGSANFRKSYTVDFALPLKSFGLDAERNKNLDICLYRLIQHDGRPSHRKVATWGGADPRNRATWGVLKFE